MLDMSSHPARGAWIETSHSDISCIYYASRTPRGVRGLKLDDGGRQCAIFPSHPARGAWIETRMPAVLSSPFQKRGYCKLLIVRDFY